MSPFSKDDRMDLLLLALTIGLPLIKILLFPARTMGRGGSWTLVGAGMIVVVMMALWFGVRSLSDVCSALATSSTATAAATPQLPDFDGLAKGL